MAFVVETGEGLPDATAFISVAFAKEYWDDRGRSYSAYDDAQIEAAIVRATMYLSESFTWKGYRTKQRNYLDPLASQSLEWPRVGVVDESQHRADSDFGYGDYGYGILIPDDVIPRPLKWATAEIAYHELTDPGAFAPSHTTNRIVETEKVGPVSITYDTSASKAAANARPTLPFVIDLIGEFLAVGSTNALSGQTVRM